jgi:hypothetical protein
VTTVAQLSRRTQLFAGGASVALGLLIAVLVHAHPESLRAPAWVVHVAATMFVLVGACLLSVAWGVAWLQPWLGLGIAGCLFAVSAWIAFGPGEMECSISFPYLVGVAPDALCRGMFGLGSLLAAVFVALLIRRVVLGRHNA